MENQEINLSNAQVDEYRLEIENRIRNLFWTISGDYSAEIHPDVETYRISPELALYNAIKQGALAKYFEPEKLALYTMKKCARGADETMLMELTQLCVDTAVYPYICSERSGVEQIRRNAFVLLSEDTPDTPVKELRQCIIGHFLKKRIFPMNHCSAISKK